MPARPRSLRVPIALCAVTSAVAVEPVLEPPTSSPGNYDRIALGHFASVEEAAVQARATGPEAAWHNPAGLARERVSTVSGNASAFERSEVRVRGAGAEHDEQQLNLFPTFVGTSVPLGPVTPDRSPLVLGMALATSENWDQSISLFDRQPVGSGSRAVSFENESALTTLVPTASVGWRAAEHLDLGVALRVGYTTLDELRTTSSRLEDGSGVPTEATKATSSIALSAWTAQATAGLRWRIEESWHLGVTLASPGLQLAGDGSVLFDITFEDEDFTATGRLRESDLDVEIRIPWSLGVGLAYQAERWAVEADCRIYGDPGDYAVVEIDEPLRFDIVPKNGDPAFTTKEDIDTTKTATRATVVVALGGHFDFTDTWGGHAGISYNASPVDGSDDDSAYRDLDLWSLAIGLSRNGESVSTVAGLRYSFGEDDAIAVDDLVTGDRAEVDLEVSILTLVVSTAYRF